MAIATISTSTISGNITVAMIANGIRDALITSGYFLFDSYLSGSTEIRVLGLTYSNAAKGTVYLYIAVSNSGTITYNLYESWNVSTRVAPTPTVGSAIGASTGTTSITIRIVSHNEFKGINLEQGTVQAVIGLLRPNGSPPSWWNEANYPYCFLVKSNNAPTSTRFSCTSTPFGNSLDHEYNQNSKMQDGNAIFNDARSVYPLGIWSFGSAGMIASCNDLMVIASNTHRPGDTATFSADEKYYYFWVNNTHSGIVIRIV